jgi:phenylalanyl-tRNA synthetase beta chain
MRFSEAWLREWVNPPVDTRTLADQLSMAGLEVDALEPAAPAFSGVVVGLVESVAPHPDAEKLRICSVRVGQGEPLQIICGAANVAEGMHVPTALVGAELPGGLRIKRAKLRGVESLGMICSAKELGLAESSEGILPLPVEAPVGQDFRAWLALDDTCIEVDLTPDRGDCLSLAGLAREVAAINRLDLTPMVVAPVPASREDHFPVRLLAPEACPRYVCRVIRGIDPTAETPLWMRERLRRGGLRAISPVVDVTNYVMLELGQPMHGFDLARLEPGDPGSPGAARRAAHPPQWRGGEPEARHPGDRRRLWSPGAGGDHGGQCQRGWRRRYPRHPAGERLFRPCSHRRQGPRLWPAHRLLPPLRAGRGSRLQVRAIERATRLLLDIAGGEPGPVSDLVSEDHRPRPGGLGPASGALRAHPGAPTVCRGHRGDPHDGSAWRRSRRATAGG